MTAVLYLAASTHAAAELADLAREADVVVEPTARGCALRAGAVRLAIEVVHDVERAVARSLEAHYDAVLVDVGVVAAGPAPGMDPMRLLDGYLEGMRAEKDRERRMRKDRIFAVVHDDGPGLDRALFTLGFRRIGGWIRGAGLEPMARRRFVTSLVQHLTASVRPPPSKKALCAAGGGITGVYYELGVMKCLEDTLGGFSVHDFDMYFGISAGAIVSSLLANDIPIETLLREIDPRNTDGFGLELRLRDLTVPDLPRRLLTAVDQLRDYLERVRLGEERWSVTAALSQLSALAGPFFRADELRARLVRLLEQRGRTDDFRALRHELFIGATDQDLREHVLFGAEGWKHVPVSLAVQASAAIHPFLASVEIDGRRYTDGFVTRTTNIAAAVDRGANLVVIVDPFLPYISELPGFNDRHSLFWVLVQDYKTVAYTRYEKVSDVILETHPRVTSIAFLPSNRMRRLLASNPLSTANYPSIVTQAYASTYRRLERLAYKLAPVLAEHGIELTLDKAAARTRLIDAMPGPDIRPLLP